MKTILVTGANRGIGLEICRQLAALGHTVVLGSRDYEKGVRAAADLPGRTIVRQLDVTREPGILAACQFVEKEFGKLDVLINNAGINSSSGEHQKSLLGRAKGAMEEHIPGVRSLTSRVLPVLKNAGLISKKGLVTEISPEEVESVMNTNLYGAWRMIQAFLPLLEKSQNGRIINISSGMGELKKLEGDYAGYRMSKVALNALTIMCARELERKGIRVNAMCPGWVKTDMGGPDAPRSVKEGADTAVWLATEQIIPTGMFFRDRKEIGW